MVVIQENILLACKTTFEIGGKARYFAEVSNHLELKEVIEFAKNNGLDFLVFSGGSNILFTGDFDGVVIQMVSNEILSKVTEQGLEIVSDAGVQLKKLVEYAANKGFRGFENLYGIPGSVGGAVRGNAGAFGAEISDALKEVVVFDINNFEVMHLSKNECGFSYRNSIFKQKPNYIILNARFVLTQQDESKKILQDSKMILAERQKRHLQDVKAAGSFFKNPTAPEEVARLFENEKGVKSKQGRVPAGWLIEKVGFKGKKIGGAICSDMHPNYILNNDNATAQDILNLASQIKKAVREEFGILLEEEVEIV